MSNIDVATIAKLDPQAGPLKASRGRRPSKRFNLRSVTSPYALAIFGYGIFLAAWCFPPNLYIAYVDERDLMFLDPVTFAFFTLCFSSFIFGVYATSSSRKVNVPAVPIRVSSALLYLLPPILVASIACSIFLSHMASSVNILSLLASAQGDILKQAQRETNGVGEGQDKWAISVLILTGVLWWASSRSKQIPMRASDRLTFRIIFLSAFMVDLFTCLALADRGRLMPLIAGLAIIEISHKALKKGMSVVNALGTLIIALITILITFLFLSFLRGARAADDLVTNVLGYTLVSYNRLAALLSGEMHYQYGGRGVYLFPYLVTAKRLNSYIDLSHAFQWPSATDVWRSEFGSVAFAGLNQKYIWAGFFGYLYSDIGWFSLLYIFVVGILAGCLWIQFRRGSVIGVILYPWIAFTVLFWQGSNILFSNPLVDLTDATVCLWAYDRLVTRNARTVSGPRLVRRLATSH